MREGTKDVLAGLIVALAIMLLVGLVLVLTGCASKVTGGTIRNEVKQGEERIAFDGGQERKAESGLRVRISPEGAVEIETDRRAVATTQPSVSMATTRPSELQETTGPSATSYGATPKTGTVTQGKLGGVSFEELKNPSNWPLFAAFLIAAAVMWKLVGSIPGAIICLGCALLAVLYPALLTWLAVICIVGTVAALAYKHRAQIREFVQGGDNVIRRFGEDAKVEMERAHSAETKKAVRAAKGKA